MNTKTASLSLTCLLSLVLLHCDAGETKVADPTGSAGQAQGGEAGQGGSEQGGEAGQGGEGGSGGGGGSDAGSAGTGGSAQGGASGQAGTSGQGGTSVAGSGGSAQGGSVGSTCDNQAEPTSQGSCYSGANFPCNPITSNPCKTNEVCLELGSGKTLCTPVNVYNSYSTICDSCNNWNDGCVSGLSCISGVCLPICCEDSDCSLGAKCQSVEGGKLKYCIGK
jgi:hypothetical protein